MDGSVSHHQEETMKTRILPSVGVVGVLCGLALALHLLSARAAAGAALPPPSCSCGAETPVIGLPDTLSAPGLYCVTGDLSPLGSSDGITIEASGVVLDLHGHTLTSGGGVPHDVTIRNGRLEGWAGGGVEATEGVRHHLYDLRITDCGTGISLGFDSLVENVTVEDSAQFGIITGPNCTLRNCRTDSNEVGIFAGSSSLVERCVASENTLLGIEVLEDGIVRTCRAFANEGNGFHNVDGGAEIRDSIARDNDGIGIRVGSSSRVIDCLARDNGTGGVEARSFSHVEGTTCVGTTSGPGIVVDGDCTVVRCVASINTVGIEADRSSQVLHCVANLNQSHGIQGTDSTARVLACTADDNGGDGIRVIDGSRVQDNQCADNGGAGVHAEGRAIRIESNSLWGNDVGIRVVGTDNLVVCNDLASNVVLFDIPPGNTRGPNGTMSGWIHSTNPYMNFNLTFPF
jgi:hypothetical protein